MLCILTRSSANSTSLVILWWGPSTCLLVASSLVKRSLVSSPRLACIHHFTRTNCAFVTFTIFLRAYDSCNSWDAFSSTSSSEYSHHLRTLILRVQCCSLHLQFAIHTLNNLSRGVCNLNPNPTIERGIGEPWWLSLWIITLTER